jgi:hypothetical protein
LSRLSSTEATPDASGSATLLITSSGCDFEWPAWAVLEAIAKPRDIPAVSLQRLIGPTFQAQASRNADAFTKQYDALLRLIAVTGLFRRTDFETMWAMFLTTSGRQFAEPSLRAANACE